MDAKPLSTDTSNDAAHCVECGYVMPPDWPRGLCPRCALGDADTPAVGGDETITAGAPAFSARDFGDYQLLEEIARGGMGVVYRARQKSLNREVALKMILSGQFASKQEILRFRGEAESAANLRHPNIVAIYETGEHAGQHYFSMEFVQGRDLGQIVRDGPLPFKRVANYVRTVAQAIHYAHEHGVLHRDLKPSNILIDEQDQPRITDFGLAKRARDNFGLTATGQVLGSPNFMPPEQALGRSVRIGPTADVYGIGAILYTLLTGRPPFLSETIDGVLMQLRDQEPVSPRLLLPTIPRDLETICLKCLEKETSKRYSTARELAEEMDRFLRDEPIQTRPAGTPEKVLRWCRRRPLIAGLIALLHVFGIIGLSGILWQWNRAETNAEAERRERNRAEIQAYAADMNLAQQALAANNLGRARELLDRHRPAAGRPDRRGWEWRHLWQETRGDEFFTLCQKSIPIFSLAVSSDEKLLAVGERNFGHLTVWDVESRRELARLPEGEHPDVFYIRAAFSPTEPLLAYGSSSGYPPTNLQSRVRLWNLKTHRQVAELPLEFLCSGLAFSPDGQSLITSTSFGTKVWDVHSGRVRVEYPGGSHQGIGTPFSITPDFRLLAQAGNDGQLRVFDLTRAHELWRATDPEGTAEAVALSADGKMLATSGGADGAPLILRNAETGEVITRLTAHPRGVTQLLFLADGKTLVSANADQTIGAWDVSDPERVPAPRLLIGHELEVWRLAYLREGKTLISGGKDGAVKFWDLQALPRHRGPIQLAADSEPPMGTASSRGPGSFKRPPFVGWSFTESGNAILTCDVAGQVAQWTGVQWQTMHVLLEAGADIATARFLPDRHRVVIGYGRGEVKVWDWTAPLESRTLLTLPDGDWSWVLCRHGERMAVGRFDQRVVIDFDLRSWEEIERWEAPGTLASMAFTPDDRFCVMGGYRGQILVHDRMTGKYLSPIPDVPNSASVAVSPDGAAVAIANEQGFAELWQPRDWRLQARFGGFLRSVGDMTFSSDGQRLVAGSSGVEAVRLFDLQQFQPLITLAANGSLFAPQFSPSGDHLAAQSSAGAIWIWPAPSWAEIADRENRGQMPR